MANATSTSRASHLRFVILYVVTSLSMMGAIWMVFQYAPDEKIMGAVQRVFYFHVPAAFVTYFSVAVLLAGSIAYLWTRQLRWDSLSKSAAETGLFFCTLVLITGPIWAKPVWGTWWTWEARLTTTLILWVLLAACLVVRGYASGRELGARLAAVLGILAAIDIPIIHKAVEWWRGQHPEVFRAGNKGSLDPAMSQTFLFTTIVFFLLFFLLLSLRYRQARLDDRVEDLTERLHR